MAKFPKPPLDSPLTDKTGATTPVWQRHLVNVTNRLTQPNAPVVTAPPTLGGAPGDIKVDGHFIYVCVAVNTWKKVAIA